MSLHGPTLTCALSVISPHLRSSTTHSATPPATLLKGVGTQFRQCLRDYETSLLLEFTSRA